MANYYGHGRESRRVSGTTVLFASLAAMAIAGPLLAMMGFSLLASATLLLVSSPILLLFSPLLLGVAFLFMATLAGFAAAAAMALVGVSILGWIIQDMRESFGGFRRMGDLAQIMKGKGRENWTDHYITTSA